MVDLFVHSGTVEFGEIMIGQNVNLEIDIEKEKILRQIIQQLICYMSL